MGTVFPLRAEGAVIIRQHITIVQSAVCTQPSTVKEPKKELALLWGEVVPNLLREIVIVKIIKTERVVFLRIWRLPVTTKKVLCPQILVKPKLGALGALCWQ